MSLKTVLAGGLFALHWQLSQAGPADVSFCKDKACNDCPVSLTSEGDGYPDCVVYNSKDVFHGGGFPGSDVGGYAPYISVSQPDDNCQLILTTPAHVSEEHCGVPVAAYSHAACGSVTVDSTFMVQYCCGAEDCNNAGVGLRSLGGKPKKIELTVDGKVVEPAQIGSPPPAIRQLESAKLRTLVKNDDDDDGICDGDWVADEGKEDYTRESDDRQVVYSNFNGGEVQITKTREQSWTQETSASLGFADVLSLGLSFSESYEKSVSDSTSYTYSTKPGQTGSIVFTPTLRCSTGTGTCDGDEVRGEFCTGIKDGDMVVGTYSLVVHD